MQENKASEIAATIMPSAGSAPIANQPVPPAAPTPALAEDKGVDFSSRFAALSRKEKQLMELAKKTKEKEALFNSGRYVDLEELKKDANIENRLSKLGLTYDEITKFYLSKGGSPLEDKVKTLEQRLEEKEIKEKQLAEEQKQSILDNQISAFKEQIKNAVNASPEKFGLISETEGFDTVYDVIEEHFAQTSVDEFGEPKQGEILSIEKAAEHVENFLLERMKKIIAHKKLAPFIDEHYKKQASLQESQQQGVNETQAPKTLTNKLVNSPSPKVDDGRLLSEDESKKRMAEFLKSQLKK